MAARLAFEVLEDVAGGAAQLEGGFGGDRFDVGRAAHAVGAEDLFGGTHISEAKLTVGGEEDLHLIRLHAHVGNAGRDRYLDALAQVAGGPDPRQIHDCPDVFVLQVSHGLRVALHRDLNCGGADREVMHVLRRG